MWFTEKELPYSKSDIKISARISKVLYDKKSPFGHIQIYDTPFYGRMLTLDGIIQVAEKDEFIYHEMMVTLPAVKHGSPKKVLIIGGGDGGAVKQALRIKSVEKIVLVEIDTSVIEMCQKYLPNVGNGSLKNSKVKVVIADGYDYIEKCHESFDIIVLDLTDPIPDSPAERLFSKPLYDAARNLLTKEGVLSTHCGSLLFQTEEVKTLIKRLGEVFEDVVLHHAVVPTYQLTSFGFLIASKKANTIDKETISKGFANISGQSQYLSPQIFETSQVLPPYIQKKLA